MIIDAHAHISDTDYGSLKIYEEEAAKINADKAILFPGGSIDVRKMTRYIAMKETPENVPVNNDLLKEIMSTQSNKYRAFWGINPKLTTVQEALDDFEDAVKKYGFAGLKLSPTSHQFSFTNKIIQELMNFAGELGVPVYSHTVFAPGASTDKFAFCAKTFPKTNFIIGHMGFGPADIDAVEYAKENDNLYMETSGGSYSIIKTALERLGDEKVIFGSEFPLQSIKSEYEKIMQVDSRYNLENVFANNIVRLTHAW